MRSLRRVAAQLAAVALLAGCDAMPSGRAPVVIEHRDRNAVTTWIEIGAAAASMPPAPTGATPTCVAAGDPLLVAARPTSLHLQARPSQTPAALQVPRKNRLAVIETAIPEEHAMNPTKATFFSRLPIVAALGLAACGGGGDGDAQASREQSERANEPVVIGSHGPNAVSVWNEIAFNTTLVASSPAG